MSARDVAQVVAAVGLDAFFDDVIQALAAAFRSYDPAASVARAHDGFHYEKPDLGLLEWMPTLEIGGHSCIKVVGYHPSNPGRRGLPSVLSTTSLYDTASGEIVALAESTLLTAIRTGAASAVAAEILAVDRPLVVGVVGCGAQAVTQIHGLSRVRQIEEVLAFDSDAHVSASLEHRLGIGIPVRAIDSARHRWLLREVDVLITCTSVGIAEGPVVEDAETRPWIHVSAVGADFAGKVELPKAFLDRSHVFPDNRDQCLAEGECQQLDADAIGPALPDLVKQAEDFRQLRDRSTVFDSTGWALQDYVIMQVLLDHANRMGVGTEIELTLTPRDPYDPYEVLRSL